ncbi:hypothetical protein J7S33_09935, partial [Saccharothrix algeriensis]
MNGPGVHGSEAHSVPASVPSGELVSAVLEGGFVNDRRTSRWQRVAAWWSRSSRVPAALKSRRLAVQAVKDLLVA